MDAVLNWLWQGCVVAVALRLMLFPLERASANVRSVVCWAATLFVIALPTLPSLPPTITSAALPGAFRATGSEAIVSLPPGAGLRYGAAGAGAGNGSLTVPKLLGL